MVTSLEKPAGKLPEDLKAEAKAHKPETLRLLEACRTPRAAHGPPAPALPEFWRVARQLLDVTVEEISLARAREAMEAWRSAWRRLLGRGAGPLELLDICCTCPHEEGE